MDQDECERIRQQQNDFLACLEWGLNPFVSAVDIQQRTWGVTGAWQVHPKFSVGATVRYQTLREQALTFRVSPDLLTAQVTAQATAKVVASIGMKPLRATSQATEPIPRHPRSYRRPPRRLARR